MPLQPQIKALLTRSLISVPVSFGLGAGVSIKVEPFEILGQIKGKVLEELGVAVKRFPKEILVFYEVTAGVGLPLYRALP